MAIAHLHGGPLAGQVIPLDDVDQQTLIVPYSSAQLVYRRTGELSHTGSDDGPTEARFSFVEESDELVPDDS